MCLVAARRCSPIRCGWSLLRVQVPQSDRHGDGRTAKATRRANRQDRGSKSHLGKEGEGNQGNRRGAHEKQAAEVTFYAKQRDSNIL